MFKRRSGRAPPLWRSRRHRVRWPRFYVGLRPPMPPNANKKKPPIGVALSYFLRRYASNAWLIARPLFGCCSSHCTFSRSHLKLTIFWVSLPRLHPLRMRSFSSVMVCTFYIRRQPSRLPSWRISLLSLRLRVLTAYLVCQGSCRCLRYLYILSFVCILVKTGWGLRPLQ